MARLVLFASGNGSNFESIVRHLRPTMHEVALLVCDRAKAFVLERAKKLEIPSVYVSYFQRDRLEAEKEILSHLEPLEPDLLVLAGYMRVFTPSFIQRFAGSIVNIHPALLPKHPGAHGIRDSFDSSDRELGITIHYVDDGVDTGPVIFQKSFTRSADETLETAEARIHELEHAWYPVVIHELLDNIDEEHT